MKQNFVFFYLNLSGGHYGRKYTNRKLLILNNKLTDPTFHLQILYDSEVINSLSFNNERMVYEMKKEIEELLIKLKEKNKKVRKK